MTQWLRMWLVDRLVFVHVSGMVCHSIDPYSVFSKSVINPSPVAPNRADANECECDSKWWCTFVYRRHHIRVLQTLRVFCFSTCPCRKCTGADGGNGRSGTGDEALLHVVIHAVLADSRVPYAEPHHSQTHLPNIPPVHQVHTSSVIHFVSTLALLFQ